MAQKHWLFKSEPQAFSIDDLWACTNRTDHWDGIRNYQARNYMRDEMQVGDAVLFYHSSTKVPGVVGRAQVVRQAYPDHTAWDIHSPYHDPKSTPENPRWCMVDVRAEERFPAVLSLVQMRGMSELDGLLLLKKGVRLSIQPLSKAHFEVIVTAARACT